jgi:hypothetical protein
LHPILPYIKPKGENNINKIELISVMPYQNGFALSSLVAHPYFGHPYFGNVLALGLYLTQKITPWPPLSFCFFALFFSYFLNYYLKKKHV